LRIERDCGQDDQILLVTENPLHNITTAATLRDQHRVEITVDSCSRQPPNRRQLRVSNVHHRFYRLASTHSNLACSGCVLTDSKSFATYYALFAPAKSSTQRCWSTIRTTNNGTTGRDQRDGAVNLSLARPAFSGTILGAKLRCLR